MLRESRQFHRFVCYQLDLAKEASDLGSDICASVLEYYLWKV